MNKLLSRSPSNFWSSGFGEDKHVKCLQRPKRQRRQRQRTNFDLKKSHLNLYFSIHFSIHFSLAKNHIKNCSVYGLPKHMISGYLINLIGSLFWPLGYILSEWFCPHKIKGIYAVFNGIFAMLKTRLKFCQHD